MTAKEFRAWEHYESLEPFGETRADYRAASVRSMIYNMNRGPDSSAMSVEDALLKFVEKEPARKQTWQEQLFMLKIIGMQAQMAYANAEKEQQ